MASITSHKKAVPTIRLVYVRDLLRELVLRDLKLRYKRSVIGILWSLVNPLVQILIFTFLFSRVLPLNIPNYTVFVFSGVLAWTWFQTSLSMASGAIVDNRELVRRPGFPVAVLPVVTVTTSMIHFTLALPVLAFFLIFGGGHIGLATLFLPLIMLVQFLLTLGLAYLIAAAHVIFRDTQHLITLGLMLMFYLTPVFYRADNVPEQYRLIYALNPMAHLLTAYRAVLVQGVWPATGTMALLFVMALILLAIGYAVFQHVSLSFVEEL